MKALGLSAAASVLAWSSGAGAAGAETLDLTRHWAGYAALAIFGTAYLLVMLEEATHLKKSQPVIMAAGLIWLLVGLVYRAQAQSDVAAAALRHNLLEYGELLLFLLSAITYVNSMEERQVFAALRSRLVSAGLTYRQLYWATGALAFVISTLANNLTTALVMGAVVVAMGKTQPRFIALSCISVVVAANAGGAFTPFGDITTLMVWQAEKSDFLHFFTLFLPALVNYLVPALIMSLAVPKGRPEPELVRTAMKPGAKGTMVLFGLTMLTAVWFQSVLAMSAAFGMIMGLTYLQLYSFIIHRRDKSEHAASFNPYAETARAEWDTLLFFYGVVLCVGGLSLIGYLAVLSDFLYGQWGPVAANTAIGVLSAVLDNIPLTFAVLSANPPMSLGHWLLVTLTTGVGGSLLSVGSAAGVALMGTARGHYTFLSHLKWTWAIALGYGASIALHLFLNRSQF
jgi:Na+/H+ antiporter NhaD/arsenite permease-like protein